MKMKSGIILILVFCSGIYACKKQSSANSRNYRMGFQLSAPRFEADAMLQVLDIWTSRADAAMITTEVPWDSLYSGITPEDFVKT